MTMMTGESTDAAWFYLQDCYKQEQDFKQLMLDGLTKFSSMDTFNDLNSKYEEDRMCDTLAEPFDRTDGIRARNITLDKCQTVLKGILVNGGLTETLFYILKNIQDVLLIFGDRNLKAADAGLSITKGLLKRAETNELISLNEIYI